MNKQCFIYLTCAYKLKGGGNAYCDCWRLEDRKRGRGGYDKNDAKVLTWKIEEKMIQKVSSNLGLAQGR